MEKFVPREKLSKRKRKEADGKNRLAWDISPVTRLKESKKVYKRKKTRYSGEGGYDGSFFIGFCNNAMIKKHERAEDKSLRLFAH